MIIEFTMENKTCKINLKKIILIYTINIIKRSCDILFHFNNINFKNNSSNNN